MHGKEFEEARAAQNEIQHGILPFIKDKSPSALFAYILHTLNDTQINISSFIKQGCIMGVLDYLTKYKDDEVIKFYYIHLFQYIVSAIIIGWIALLTSVDKNVKEQRREQFLSIFLSLIFAALIFAFFQVVINKLLDTYYSGFDIPLIILLYTLTMEWQLESKNTLRKAYEVLVNFAIKIVDHIVSFMNPQFKVIFKSLFQFVIFFAAIVTIFGSPVDNFEFQFTNFTDMGIIHIIVSYLFVGLIFLWVAHHIHKPLSEPSSNPESSNKMQNQIKLLIFLYWVMIICCVISMLF